MTSQGPSGYYNFGVQISDRSSLTAVTRLLPQLLQVINAFLSEVWPAGTWNAVCVGRNTTARAHRDLANTPGSMNLTLSVGEFAGGQLWVEDVNGDTPVCLPDGVLLDGSLRNTRNAPLLFPCEKWHQTFPFQGERWVLTAYHMPGVAHHVITDLGFPLVPPQPAATGDVSEPAMQMGEAALSVLRAEADKFLAPKPHLAVPRGSPVGVSPKPPESTGLVPHAVVLDLKPLASA